ncbi:MAG: hypothetical protein ONB13_13530, partial [candidate division KSB1 bacterium]|nr:hypothetical protein [candidate division KSB1 bacterium]
WCIDHIRIFFATDYSNPMDEKCYELGRFYHLKKRVSSFYQTRKIDDANQKTILKTFRLNFQFALFSSNELIIKIEF